MRALRKQRRAKPFDSSNTTNVEHSPPTALEIYAQQEREAQVLQLLREAVAPFLFDITNRLAKMEDQLQALDFQQDVAAMSRVTWWGQAIDKALELLRDAQYRTPPTPQNVLVKRLQRILKVDRNTAIQVLKIAEDRVRAGGQVGLDGWQ